MSNVPILFLLFQTSIPAPPPQTQRSDQFVSAPKVVAKWFTVDGDKDNIWLYHGDKELGKWILAEKKFQSTHRFRFTADGMTFEIGQKYAATDLPLALPKKSHEEQDYISVILATAVGFGQQGEDMPPPKLGGKGKAKQKPPVVAAPVEDGDYCRVTGVAKVSGKELHIGNVAFPVEWRGKGETNLEGKIVAFRGDFDSKRIICTSWGRHSAIKKVGSHLFWEANGSLKDDALVVGGLRIELNFIPPDLRDETRLSASGLLSTDGSGLRFILLSVEAGK
jgi:hypothetical protein